MAPPPGRRSQPQPSLEVSCAPQSPASRTPTAPTRLVQVRAPNHRILGRDKGSGVLGTGVQDTQLHRDQALDILMKGSAPGGPVPGRASPGFVTVLLHTSLFCSLVLGIWWPESRHSGDQRLRQSLCPCGSWNPDTWTAGESQVRPKLRLIMCPYKGKRTSDGRQKHVGCLLAPPVPPESHPALGTETAQRSHRAQLAVRPWSRPSLPASNRNTDQNQLTKRHRRKHQPWSLILEWKRDIQ